MIEKIKKRLPIGLSDFKAIIEDDYYYVDKSLLISEIIDSGKVVLITRPRRFGKTLNQYMLKYFFDLKEDNAYLFKDLKICEDKEIIDNYLNKYPVIFFSLKGVKSNNYKDLVAGVKSLVSKLYGENDFLLKENTLKKNEKEIYNLILKREATIDDYKKSLVNLTEYLSRYYNKKVVLIIDEYDIPILEAYKNNYYEEFIEFFKVFLGEGLKDNVYLEKAVLTGIMKIAKESIFSDLNNLKVSTILGKLCNDKYGLLKEEVIELLKYYNLDYEEEDVINWYNGYNFGGVEIYNPFSIINLADEGGEIKSYWINTSGNYLIKEIIKKGSVKVKKGIERLISGATIESEIEETMVYEDLKNGDESKIWTLFLFSGYLKWVDKKIDDEGEKVIYTFQITNREAKGFYLKILREILRETSIKLDEMFYYILNGNLKKFKLHFREMVERSLSYYDVGGKEPEKFYHGLILGMMVGLNDYKIKSNRESGYGRADVMIIPKQVGEKGVIIEFKKYSEDSDKNLLESAIAGLNQIEEKKYEEELKSNGASEVIKIGIGFYKKELEIVTNYDDVEELRNEYQKRELEKVKKVELSSEEKVALSLLNSGVDIDIVAKSTGFSIEKLEELRNKKNEKNF